MSCRACSADVLCAVCCVGLECSGRTRDIEWNFKEVFRVELVASCKARAHLVGRSRRARQPPDARETMLQTCVSAGQSLEPSSGTQSTQRPRGVLRSMRAHTHACGAECRRWEHVARTALLRPAESERSTHPRRSSAADRHTRYEHNETVAAAPPRPRDRRRRHGAGHLLRARLGKCTSRPPRRLHGGMAVPHRPSRDPEQRLHAARRLHTPRTSHLATQSLLKAFRMNRPAGYRRGDTTTECAVPQAATGRAPLLMA